MSQLLLDSLGNVDWLIEKKNIDGLLSLFPETYTDVRNINLMKIGFSLKLLGVDWRSEDELKKVIQWCETIGILEREGLTIRRHRNCPLLKWH